MYSIIAKKAENRLYIVLSGRFDMQDTAGILQDLIARAKELEPGFDVINDIRQVKFANTATSNEIKKGTAALEKAGARAIVRVVGKSKYALLLFAKFAQLSTKSSKTKIFHVPSMEAAELKLSSI